MESDYLVRAQDKRVSHENSSLLSNAKIDNTVVAKQFEVLSCMWRGSSGEGRNAALAGSWLSTLLPNSALANHNPLQTSNIFSVHLTLATICSFLLLVRIDCEPQWHLVAFSDRVLQARRCPTK